MSGDLLVAAVVFFLIACGCAVAGVDGAGRLAFRAATVLAVAAFLLAALQVVAG